MSMMKVLECSAQGKRPAVKDFLGTLELGTEIFSPTEEYKSSWKMDLTFAVARLSPVKLFKEEDQRRGENNETIHQTLPGISRYHAANCYWILSSDKRLFHRVLFTPEAQNMCTSLNQKDVVITFDQQIHLKAKQIMWKYPDEVSYTLIRLGGYHIALNFLAVLGKRYQGSGIGIS